MTPAQANEISTLLSQYTDSINQADALRVKLEEMREKLGVEL